MGISILDKEENTQTNSILRVSIDEKGMNFPYICLHKCEKETE